MKVAVILKDYILVKACWVLYQRWDHTPSATIPIAHEGTVLLLICSMLYSQFFTREMSVVCTHEWYVVSGGGKGC